MNNTVIYCRTANGGISEIQAQLHLLFLKNMEAGCNSFEVYCDCDQSGATLERPELHKILQSVQRGEVKKILVCNYARLSRNKIHLSELLNFFREHEVEIVTRDADYDIDEAKTHLTDILENIREVKG